jgi:hypothetical protein
MRRSLFLLLVFFSLAAGAASVFGPARLVTAPSYSVAYGWQYPEDAATDSHDFLTLWIDQTPGRTGVYSAVVLPEGTVTPVPSHLVRFADVHAISVVWTGDHYLATWTEPAGVFAARLSRDGTVDGEPHVIAAHAMSFSHTLAWNGRHALLALQDGGLTAMLLDADGNVVRRGIPLPPSIEQIAVAAAGSAFAVTGAESHYVYAMGPAPPPGGHPSTAVYLERVSDAGEVLDPAPIVLASSLTSYLSIVALAGDASRFAVAYPSSDTPGVTQVIRHLVDAATGTVTSLPAFAAPALSGVLSTGGDLVAYGPSGNGGLYAERFSSSNMTTVDLAPVAMPQVRLVTNGSQTLAVWSDQRVANNPHVYAALLDRDANAVSKTVTVSTSAAPQQAPALASGANGALLVWSELHRYDSADIMAARIDESGQPAGAPITIQPGASNAAVVFTGEVYVVAYVLGNQIVARRVAVDGTLLDAQPYVLGSGWNFALASNGTTTFAVFGGSGSGVHAVRLNRDGTVAAGAPLTVSDDSTTGVAIAAAGSEFLVVWVVGSDYWQWPSPNYVDIFGARLDANGSLLDPKSFAIADSPRDEVHPTVASDGRDFLVAYSDDQHVEVKKVLREGALAGTTSAANGTPIGDGLSSAIAREASRYVIAFTTVAGARFAAVSDDGAVIDPAREIPDGSVPQNAALASFGGGVLLAYSSVVDGPVYERIPRLFIRQLTDVPARAHAARH